MCAPVLAPLAAPAAIASAGAALAGTGLQLAGQNQAMRAQARATRAEAGRQFGYAAAGRDAVDQARQTWEAEPAISAAAQGERRAALDAAAASATGTGYLPGQSQAIRVETDRARADNTAVMGAENANRARLGSWGDTLLAGRVASSRSGSDVARQGSFSRGSAGVLPVELQAAGTRGMGLRTAGDLAMGATLLAAPFVAAQYPTWGSIFGTAPAKSAQGVAAYNLGERLMQRGIY